MSITTHLPTTRTGRGATLAGVAGLWVLAYWVNGWLWDALLYDLLGMPADERLTETLHFFVYDTVKIGLLLSGIIFVITILRSYMSIERTRALLGGRHGHLLLQDAHAARPPLGEVPQHGPPHRVGDRRQQGQGLLHPDCVARAGQFDGS